jgi:hypothetical protein
MMSAMCLEIEERLDVGPGPIDVGLFDGNLAIAITKSAFARRSQFPERAADVMSARMSVSATLHFDRGADRKHSKCIHVQSKRSSLVS